MLQGLLNSFHLIIHYAESLIDTICIIEILMLEKWSELQGLLNISKCNLLYLIFKVGILFDTIHFDDAVIPLVVDPS